MSSNFPRIRSAIYGQPWAITESGLELICSVFEGAESGAAIAEKYSAAALSVQPQSISKRYEVNNGVAVIPIMGPLFPRANLLTRISGATSYDESAAMLSDALGRNDVISIMLRADSPGGSVTGCFEIASTIFEARKTTNKPIIGLIEGQGCSACYALMSQCDTSFCTMASVVGSIGVIMKMDNFDRAEKNQGNDVMVMRSTELKAPGMGPVTPNQIASLQKTLMKFDAMFDETVLRGRPSINIEEVSTGETWIGQDAVDIGLIDGVSTFGELIKNYGV